MKNGDMPAMPVFSDSGAVTTNYGFLSGEGMGLTKREYFAAMAMQGLMSADVEASLHQNDCAKIAVAHADALLAELEEER